MQVRLESLTYVSLSRLTGAPGDPPTLKNRQHELYVFRSKNFGSKSLVFVGYRVFSPQEIAVLYTFLCLVESRGLRGEGVVLPI